MPKPFHKSFLYRISFAALLLLSLSASAKGELNNDFPRFDSKSAGANFDADKITQLEARMRQFVADGDTMGIATLLVKDGQVVSHTKAGVRRIMDGAPITDDTIYRIYSMTKPITGVALMMLWEEGRFSLDDPVSKYIPEFADLQVVKSYDAEGFELESLQRQPTMRELMSHTAGFAYGLWGDDPSNRAFMQQRILLSQDVESFIKSVAGVPLMFQPGQRWFYSAAVDIQGAIVQRLSGQSFGEFLRQRIFQPLGMKDSGFYVPEQEYDRFSDVFAYHPETRKFQRVPFREAKYNVIGDLSWREDAVGMESGGGGLVSTMADYARFCQMMLNGGELNGARILKSDTVKLMHTNVLTEGQNVDIAGELTAASARKVGFGLDFGILMDGEGDQPVPGAGSYFWGGAAGTWFWIDPRNKLFFIGMIQRFEQGGPPVDFRATSMYMVYDALVGATPKMTTAGN